jgi:hypothetical protein
VEKLGTGKNVIAKVKLRGGKKLEGYISSSDNTGFEMVEPTTGETFTILYSQVRQIKGKNNLTGTQIAWGVMIGLAILSLIMLGTD